MILTRVDLPAPFSPTSACTSPSSSAKSTWSRAVTPANRLTIPSIRRRELGEPERRSSDISSTRGATSVGVGYELSGVRLIEQTVGKKNLRRDLLAFAQLVDGLESEWSESRVA